MSEPLIKLIILISLIKTLKSFWFRFNLSRFSRSCV